MSPFYRQFVHIGEVIVISVSNINMKYLKEKQSTGGIYDFEKVLCFVLTHYINGT